MSVRAPVSPFLLRGPLPRPIAMDTREWHLPWLYCTNVASAVCALFVLGVDPTNNTLCAAGVLYVLWSPRPPRVQACPEQRTPRAHGAAAGPVRCPPAVRGRQRDATLGGPFSGHGLGLCGPALALVQERSAPSAAESLGRGQRVHCDHAVGAGGLLARHTGLAGPRVNSASPCLPLLPLFVPLSLTQAHCPRPHFCLRLAV